jgi:hypothetical protein
MPSCHYVPLVYIGDKEGYVDYVKLLIDAGRPIVILSYDGESERYLWTSNFGEGDAESYVGELHYLIQKQEQEAELAEWRAQQSTSD